MNIERFTSFDIFYLRFIDSVKFLSASLDSLVENLVSSCDQPFDKFIHTREHFNPKPEDEKFIFKKGEFPYNHFDSLERFKETSLPPKDAFYNALSEKAISDESYDRALTVWETFGCRTFKDYHDLYLKLDVFLLADVFENFREIAHMNYGLDPAMYLTMLSFSWDSCLKLTGRKLELIRDPETHLFFENNIRGGISVISHRYAKANVPGTPTFDSCKPSSYILYVDANNLYDWAMSQKLPTDGFRFMSPDEIEQFKVCDVSDDSDVGYVIECDLIYPPEIHDLHIEYPLAPESLVVTEDMLSPFCHLFGQKHVDCRKLVPNLRDKKKYVVDYRNLKFYLNNGLKLGKVHRVLTFNQSEWMKPFVSFNTQKRQEAKTKVEQDTFKFTNNATFGKTMENVKNRRMFQLVCDPFKAKKLIAKPQLEQFRIINEETVLIERVRAQVTLDKPIYRGFTILELSKLVMYRFHYDIIEKRYGGRAKLLFTDTDSLTYHIDMRDFSDQLDTSNYPPTHTLYSLSNKMVLGKMEDECSGKPPVEFVGLRSKMNSLLEKDVAKMTAKGVKKSFVKNHVRHEQYLHVLQTRKKTQATFLNFRSRCHKIETVEQSKTCLSAYDDERFILRDGITTLAHGHVQARDPAERALL